MRGIFLTCVVGLSFAAGCTDREREDNGSLTRRQQDSVIGQSQLPGAQGVRDALAAADSAAARALERKLLEGGEL